MPPLLSEGQVISACQLSPGAFKEMVLLLGEMSVLWADKNKKERPRRERLVNRKQYLIKRESFVRQSNDIWKRRREN